MTERFQKLLNRRLKSSRVLRKPEDYRKTKNLDFMHDFKKKYLNDAPYRKANDEKALPSVKIKSNSYEITYKYDKRKHLNLNQPYELWARDYGHFTGICVWKDIKRDAAEFYLDDGSFRTVILTKTTYIPVKD
jgi:hypothetical protein